MDNSATTAALLADLLQASPPAIVDWPRPLSAADFARLRAEAQRREIHIAVVEYRDDKDYETALIDQISREFMFPGWAGSNWNSVQDCLTDLNWLDKAGFWCFFSGSNQLKEKDEPLYNLLREIFRSAGESWSPEGTPFRLVCVP